MSDCPCVSASHEDPACSQYTPPSTDDGFGPEDLADQADLLYLIIDKIQYDFCEDDDEVQGNWKITRVDDHVIVDYQPYDVSPYPAQTMRYRVERLP